MKVCGSCKTKKSLKDFYKKGDGWQSMCIDCTKKYHHSHFVDNRASYYASRDRSQQKIRDWIIQYKQSHPCVDCKGYFHPAAMHFHHLDPATKVDGIASLSRYSLRRVKDEVAKCELVCANCHAVKTWPDAGVVTETPAKRQS